MSRQYGVTRKSRLLCGICRELKSVRAIDIDESGITVLLDCSHRRGELLPLTKLGNVSIVLMGKPAGYLAFPVVREAKGSR